VAEENAATCRRPFNFPYLKACNILRSMKLIVNLKLQPTNEQAKILRSTLERTNQACNDISQQAWDLETFKQYDLHKLVYHPIKEKYQLNSQMVVRSIAKVADAYKLDKESPRTFKKYGSIAYDDRIIRFPGGEVVNLWTVEGRLSIPFVCGDYQRRLLPFRKGEVDLIYRKGNFYLNAVCEVEEPPVDIPDDVIGVDFGIVNIATDSDTFTHTGKEIDKVRRKYSNRRRNLQKKGRGSARRKLKQIARKQRNFQTNENHKISKRIVKEAKRTGRAIAIEELKGIRKRVTAKKAQRARLSNWSFYQLRTFIEYKARREGVQVILVDPRNTSRECSKCHYVDKANRRTQSSFLCVRCGNSLPADYNAALNIRAKALSTCQTSNLLKASGLAA
jgi:putative transposase